MNGELVKRQDRWDLYAEDGSKIGSSAQNPMNKLSIKNCQAIENGYDLDELAREACNITDPLRLDSQKYKQDPYFKIGFNKGFQKAMEILGDKKFSEEHIKVAADWYYETKGKKSIDEYIQSLQQTEWDVEIEMEQYVKYVPKSLATVYPTGGIRPKLDKDSCLILKRK